MLFFGQALAGVCGHPGVVRMSEHASRHTTWRPASRSHRAQASQACLDLKSSSRQSRRYCIPILVNNGRVAQVSIPARVWPKGMQR